MLLAVCLGNIYPTVHTLRKSVLGLYLFSHHTHMKSFLTLLFLLSFVWISLADCAPNPNFDTVCGINGQTFTNNCVWRSDTSDRAIPTAYVWVCDDYPDLSPEILDILLTSVHRFFAPYTEYIVYDYGIASTYTSWEDIPLQEREQARGYLTNEWKIFVHDTLFPRIQQKIVLLHDIPHTTKNDWTISVLHHIAYTIGYDYYLRKDITEFDNMKQ